MQIVDEADALSFGFDLLDPTKIVPEELVPVTLIGSMKLDRNPRNYFAETEQVMVLSHLREMLPLNGLLIVSLIVPTWAHCQGY